MTEEMKKKLHTTPASDDEDDFSDRERQTGKDLAAAHAASVDVTANVELHDPDSEQGTTRLGTTTWTSTYEECSHDADSNSCLDDQLEPSNTNKAERVPETRKTSQDG